LNCWLELHKVLIRFWCAVSLQIGEKVNLYETAHLQHQS
jgi:hypothetical protein